MPEEPTPSDVVDWPALILKADQSSDPERALATLANMASREVEGRRGQLKASCNSRRFEGRDEGWVAINKFRCLACGWEWGQWL